MIKSHKKRILIVIIVIFFLFILGFESYKYLKQFNYYSEMTKQLIEAGNSNLEMPQKEDMFTKTWEFFRNGATSLIQFVYPLIVILVGTITFHSVIQSGFFKDVIARETYKKFYIKQFLNSWSASLLIPLFIILAIIFAGIICDFNVTPSCSMSMINSECSSLSIKGEIIKLLYTTINLVLASIACINVGLITAKKNKNFALSVILSYLIIIIYQVIVSVIVGPLLYEIFNNNFFANGLTLFSFWYYDDGVNALNMFIYGLVLAIATSYMLYLTYKSKENVVINAEK